MEKEVFQGRSREEFVAAIKRLRAEGKEEDATRVEELLAIWDLRSGRLEEPSARKPR